MPYQRSPKLTEAEYAQIKLVRRALRTLEKDPSVSAARVVEQFAFELVELVERADETR